MTLRLLFCITLSLSMSGCNSTFRSNGLPDTLAEGYVKASYVPLDGLPIFTSSESRSCGKKQGCEFGGKRSLKDLLDALPDQTIRMTVGQYTNSGNLSYGPISLAKRNSQYQVVLDYVNNDAINIPLLIERESSKSDSKSIFADVTPDTQFSVSRIKDDKIENVPDDFFGDIINVTVYVGIGLRMTAQITTKTAGINLTSLPALSAAAEEGDITGMLTVQTIGITGPAVSSSLPLPSDITKESLQATILALGGVKSSIYDSQHTTKTARVVGIYIPVGGNELLVEHIRNALASKAVIWYRPCENTKEEDPESEPVTDSV